MKKSLSIVFVTLSTIVILDSFNAGEAMAMFLLAGVIPGTSITLGAAQMLEIFTLLIGFTLSRLAGAAFRATRQSVQYSRPKVASLVK